MKSIVCFDLDGTVLASQKGVFRSVAYAMKGLGMPVPSDCELMAFLGPPLQVGLTEVCHVPASRLDEAIRLYRTYYRETGMFEAEIYEGIPWAVRTLRENGRKCVITTSKPEAFSRVILKHFGADTLFDGIYGSLLDNTRSRKSEVLAYALRQNEADAEKSVLIGDRFYDALGAQEIGMDCVGVLYGYGSREELEHAGVMHCVETAAQLPEYLMSL